MGVKIYFLKFSKIEKNRNSSAYVAPGIVFETKEVSPAPRFVCGGLQLHTLSYLSEKQLLD